MSSSHCVCRQYENIAFEDGEALDDFVLRLAKMVHELELLGDPEEPRKVGPVSSWTLTFIERDDDIKSWGNFLVYFSHNGMPT
jgi:hypothetical protein